MHLPLRTPAEDQLSNTENSDTVVLAKGMLNLFWGKMGDREREREKYTKLPSLKALRLCTLAGPRANGGRLSEGR